MARAPELVVDHASPKQDLTRALLDARRLFGAVLGERGSLHGGEAAYLAGRLACYRRGLDALVSAQQIMRNVQIMRARDVSELSVRPFPADVLKSETEMKLQARAGLRCVDAISKKFA